MIKRMTKATSLLVAAAAIISIVPASAATSTQKLETKDGTISNAVAFDGGKYLYDGYKGSDDTSGVYYNDGSKDKLLDNVQNADLESNYANKYEYALDGSNQYLVDLSNGTTTDDQTPEDDANTISTKLRTLLKKTDRYGKGSDINVNVGYESTTKIGLLPGNKFGDNWYEYNVELDGNADGKNNTVGTKLYGFTNASGQYIDASNVANIYAYSTKEGKTVKVENFSNDINDVDSDTQLLATLAAAPEVLTQDKDYIYAMVTVNITDEGTNAVASATTTGAAADNTPTSAVVTKHTYIQKISKAQGTQKDGAYVPKTVESYELLGDDNKLDSSDAKDAKAAIDNALVKGAVTVAGNQLLAIEVNSANDNVKITSIDFKKDKVKYVSGFPQANLSPGAKVDAYLAEKNTSDDKDVNNNNGNKSYDVDVDGNAWVIGDGKIYEFKNNEFTEVYSVDSSLDSISVYDANNIIAWKEDGDIYATVGGKTTDNGGTTTPVVTAGWAKNADGTWSYNKADGTKATGWVQDGAWYFLNANGIMQTGWVNDNGTWYFLNGSGAMQTGWVNDNGTWYFLNGSGAMKTGWVNDNGTWYFLKSSGAMATGWVNDNGTWYFLNTSGAMLSNTTVDGYQLGASGAWVK